MPIMAVAPVVSLVTDFGLRDEFAGVIEGVIVRTAPDVRVIHVTHGIEPTNVLGGSLTLASAVPYLPLGVHLAVVDPGVGSERRALVLETAEGALLVPRQRPAGAGGGDPRRHRARPRDRRRSSSCSPSRRPSTAATSSRRWRRGWLAGWRPSASARSSTPPTCARRGPALEARDGVLTASVLVVDRFGNVALSARPDDLTGIGVELGGEVELTAGEGRFLARRARTFGDVRHGDMVVYDDASGWVGVAVNGSSLAAACGIVPGDVVELEPR